MIAEEECTLIIPAYNEEKRIERCLADISSFRGPIIFVCDGDDETPGIIRRYIDSQVADESGAKYPNITVLSFNERLGKGGGITAGMKAADTEYIGYCDADGATPISEMRRLFSEIETCDCAFGSRWLAASKIEKSQSLSRKVQSRIFNLCVKLILGIPFKDTQCGAKVFKRTAVEALLPRVRSSGFAFDAEILYILYRGGFMIKEVPILWSEMGGSHVGIADALKMLVNLIKIRLA